jgi:basic membrane lipoprotein Med (substrate-binding protein (PBP1-ABC) superfamily)
MVSRHLTRSIKILLGSLLILELLTPSNLPVLADVTSELPKVGLITDGGPIDDSGFNQMAYEGLTRAENEGLIDGSTYIPTGDPDIDYAGAIAQCVSDGNGLCITVGFVMGDATMAAADTYPGVHFAIVDMTWEDSVYPDNLRGLFFSVDEAAYLAGTLAGMMSTTNCIGTISGMPIPPVDDFIFPSLMPPNRQTRAWRFFGTMPTASWMKNWVPIWQKVRSRAEQT